jgi:hypothetical protein
MSNFSVLSQHDEQLLRLGMLAEKYFADDPNTRTAAPSCASSGWASPTYNLFHTRDLTPAQVAKVSKKFVEEAAAGYPGIRELRRLHRELDIAIRDAYGWSNLNLGHDFHEVETLPENDRVRYTISPAARKEVLKRLLAESHRRAAIEAVALPNKLKAKRGSKPKGNVTHGDLFA